MRFRIGLLVGAAFGYVLGARAGRERYEQIKTWAASAGRHPAVAQLADHGRGLVDAGRYMAAAALSAGARGLRSMDGHGRAVGDATVDVRRVDADLLDG